MMRWQRKRHQPVIEEESDEKGNLRDKPLLILKESAIAQRFLFSQGKRANSLVYKTEMTSKTTSLNITNLAHKGMAEAFMANFQSLWKKP